MNILTKLRNTKLEVSGATFIVLIALYFGFVLNIPVTSKIIELAHESGDGLFAYSSPLLLSAAFAIIFSVLAVPYLRKPIFIFLVLTSASASYATMKYGVMFDYSMVENIFETHTSEALSYVNLSSILYTLCLGIIPSILIGLVRFKNERSLKVRLLQRALVILGSVVVIAVIYVSSYKDYASVGRNNSYLNQIITPAHVYNMVKYIDRTYFTEPMEYKTIGEDAKQVPASNGKPSLVVLVVGETARAQNINYNGYERNTNPYTEDLGIISFQDVSSCGTATAHSLPCMFSNLNREKYKKARANHQDNALNIIQRAGVDVTWYENDGGDKSVAKKLNKIEITPDLSDKHCSDGVCVDEIMLESFDELVTQDTNTSKLVTFHIIGSHGPTYWKRYPQSHELFSPSCNQSDIENCTDEEIVNVYDNTIAYTDYVLAQTIEKLRQYSDTYNVALTYLSDHGESLGENGLYLHGTPYALAPEHQTKVPWYMWMDKAFEEAYKISRTCLEEKAQNGSFSHDNLFHTIIDLSGVKTSAVEKEKSLINGCRS